MDSRSKAVLSYVFIFISGLIFLVTEKQDEFVRKSAAQSFVFSIVFIALGRVCDIIPFVGGLLSGLVGLAGFVLWIVLIAKAGQNIYFKLPIISDLSENYVLKWF